MNNPIKRKNGNLEWVNNKGELHRDGGPAIIFNYGLELWILNGKEHRIDGPSYVDKEEFPRPGYFKYRINGNGLRKEEFNNWILRIRSMYKINYTYDSIYDDFEEVSYSR